MSQTIVTGKTIQRKNGLSLIEYSAGDQPHSYYKVVTTKGHEELGYNYLLPKKNHKLAKEWFEEEFCN